MKKLILLTLLFIGHYSFSQENSSKPSFEHERLEDIAKSSYYEKGGKLLYYDIYIDWEIDERLSIEELKNKIKDLEQIKARWEAPNGPIALSLSRIQDLHNYCDKMCSDYKKLKDPETDYITDSCKTSDFYKERNPLNPRETSSYKGAMGYWQKFYDSAHKLLEEKRNNPNSNTSNESDSNSTSNTNNSSSQSTENNSTSNSSNRETSADRLKRLDRERGEQIMQETEDNIARVKANSEQFGNSLNNIISAVFTKDRTNEAIIRNKYSENKAFISKYDREYNDYQNSIKKEIEFFNDFINNPENESLIIKAQKSFEIGYCTNTNCESGKVKNTRLILCGVDDNFCGGKGYIEVGAWVPIGQTAHPNDGKERHDKCKGSGIIKDTDRNVCEVCNGHYKKSLIYKGNQNYTQNFIIEFKKKYQEPILAFNKVKKYFKENTSKKFFKYPGKSSKDIYYKNPLNKPH